MNDDPENPPFDFSATRGRRPGEPKSSETARLRAALRSVIAAHRSGERTQINAAIHSAETVLAERD
ncbi:MAG: hypothetical protein AAF318_19620 [Pseudomonadota bacterium]